MGEAGVESYIAVFPFGTRMHSEEIINGLISCISLPFIAFVSACPCSLR